MSKPPIADDVSKLSLDAEMRRRELTDTLDEIRERFADARHQMSPDHLKGEAKQYFSDKGRFWLESAERTARENPLQAIAIAAGLAYPLLSVVKAVPKPLLAIGAGLALLRFKPAVSVVQNVQGGGGTGLADRAADMVDSTKSKWADARSAAADTLDRAGASATAAASDAAEEARTRAARVSDAIGTAADRVSAMSSDAGEAIRSKFRQGVDATAGMTQQTAQPGTDFTAATITTVRDNALILAGLGLCIGAAVAAAIPATETEEKALGPIGSNLRNRAHGLVGQGLDKASVAASDLIDRTIEAADAQGLNAETAHRALSAIGDRAEAIVKAAGASSASSASPSSKQSPNAPELQS